MNAYNAVCQITSNNINLILFRANTLILNIIIILYLKYNWNNPIPLRKEIILEEYLILYFLYLFSPCIVTYFQDIFDFRKYHAKVDNLLHH